VAEEISFGTVEQRTTKTGYFLGPNSNMKFLVD
jgi:hypothetical protein